MLNAEIELLEDPNYIPDESNGIYIVFLIIGIIGYFAIPTVAGWIIHSRGMGAYGNAVNKTAGKASSVVGSTLGNAGGRLLGK